MRDFFEFMVGSYDGELVLAYAVAGNPRVKPSEIKALLPRFEQYINEHTDEEIEEENKKIEQAFRDSLGMSKNTKIAAYSSGFVYLFECGGKYKIGVSKNVERRIKELDNRPFKLNLVSKVYSEMAYKVEQTIHDALKHYRIEGEWFNFKTEPSAEWFESLVRRAERNIGREQ